MLNQYALLHLEVSFHQMLLAPKVQELFNTVHSAASDGYVRGLWSVFEIL